MFEGEVGGAGIGWGHAPVGCARSFVGRRHRDGFISVHTGAALGGDADAETAAREERPAFLVFEKGIAQRWVELRNIHDVGCRQCERRCESE